MLAGDESVLLVLGGIEVNEIPLLKALELQTEGLGTFMFVVCTHQRD